jgi:two-component system chemotaxis response regulator CheY
MAKTILVGDDSGTVGQQVSRALKQAGFETAQAADGRDVNMPHMNRLEMVEKIKSKSENKSWPILMLTTEGQPSMSKRAKEAEAAGWIVKPFNATQLIQTAKHLTWG